MKVDNNSNNTHRYTYDGIYRITRAGQAVGRANIGMVMNVFGYNARLAKDVVSMRATAAYCVLHRYATVV